MEFPLFDHNLDEFAQVLRTEGFDAKAEVLNDQVGLAVGPKGLDINRLRPGDVELFLTLTEINDPANRVLIAGRKFHEIVENRPASRAGG